MQSLANSDIRATIGIRAVAALVAVMLLVVAAGPNASAGSVREVAPGPVVGLVMDAGVVDTNGDGQANYGSYGETNRGLSVGEQGRDGWDLRYVVPFDVPSETLAAVDAGAEARLAFTVWRAEDLDKRQLVVTGLPGDRQGRADYDRKGVEVFRGVPSVGRMQFEVSEALRALGSSTVTFRFELDPRPLAGDGQRSELNLATADARQPDRRPTITFTAPPPVQQTDPVQEEAPVEQKDPVVGGEGPVVGADPDEAVVGVRDGWRLVWSEEFDGSVLDTSVWRPYHSTYGDGNRELQCHTPDNVAVSGGTLQITARREAVRCPNGSLREFSSGFLGTRENGVYFPRFARYEMRARVPHGQGLWPAFWLRHRDGSSVAEVDIMEYFHSQVPGRTTSTLHLDGRLNLSKRTVFVEEPTSSPQWHVWAVEIDEVADGVRFRFFVDGELIHSFVDTQAKWASAHPGKPLFDIAVNLSVGGNWVGHPDDPLGYLRELDRCAKWGDPGPAPYGCDAEGIVRASFPASYEVDYVRVYQRN